MSIHIPHINILSFFRTTPPASTQVDDPRAIGKVVQTKRGWYGLIRTVGENGGYSLELVCRLQDGSYIRPYNARRMWVWESEIRS